MTYLDVIDLRVEYEKGVPTLDKFSLSVAEGELISLLGPSGCGKTTTLRTIAGFIEPVAGKIVIDGMDNTRLTPNKRDIGLVFQSYALFPHLTAAQNVAFGLRMRGVRGTERDRRVTEALKLVDLAGFGDRRPGQLSGGQRQRVALARAVVIEPKLLMFDEPLSNLDAKLRVSVRTEIRRLQQRLGITTVYVTHDQVEALAISDRVIVMNLGRIEQSGKPEHIFKEPLTPFAADFMGFDNTFSAAVESIDGQQARIRVDSTNFRVEMHQPISGLTAGDTAKVFFRSENANLAAAAQENSLPGKVLLRTFQGSHVEYIVETELGEFVVQQAEDQPRFDTGPVHLVLNPQSLIVLADR